MGDQAAVEESRIINARHDEPEPMLTPEFAACTRWQGQGEQRRGITTLQVSQLVCAACAPTIESALVSVPGVEWAQVSGSSQRAQIRWDPGRTEPSQWVQAVRRAGYGLFADEPASAQALRTQEQRYTLWRLFVASFCAMQVMMLATPSYVAGPGELADDLRQLLNWGSWVLSLPVMWFSAGPYLLAAWRSVRARHIGMEVPVTLALGVTFLASTAAAFDPAGPWGHEVYFDSLTMFLAFLWLGRYLEMRTRHRAALALEGLSAQLPEQVWRATPAGDFEQVAVQHLRVGDVIRVAKGEVLAVDGTLLNPRALVEEAVLTGESHPIVRLAGQTVFAGSTNVGWPLQLRLTQSGSDTRYRSVVALMQEALSLRPQIMRQADRWAGPFLWTVLALSMAGSMWWWWSGESSRALWVGVAVLVVSCPCAVSLALPATWVAAAGALAKSGVLLRRLELLEILPRVTHVMFDKTGTLTASQAACELLWCDDSSMSAADAWAQARHLAQWSTHPVALSLWGAAAAGQIASSPPPVVPLMDIQEVAGQGVHARDPQGRRWFLGSEVGLAMPLSLPEGVRKRARVWLVCDGQAYAAWQVAEHIKPEADRTVRQLLAQGVGVSMVSGDTQARVEAFAHSVGIEQVLAQASPEDKLTALRQKQAAGEVVCVIGDGVNDGPVLAAADCSMAMAGGSDSAQQGADAVITSQDPFAVLHAMTIAHATRRLVVQNLTWAVAYNMAAIPMALLGWLPPWLAGLGMAISSLAVMLNAQRVSQVSFRNRPDPR